MGKKAGGQSDQLYNSLLPTYQAEATNPQGYAPQDLAAMNSASSQSLGGALGAVEGEGNLAAARTRNQGSFAPVVGEAAREAMRQHSQNALGIQGQNAMLKEMNRQAGISGEAGLEGEKQNELLSSLGLGTQATNAGTQAGQSGWFQQMLGLINAGANAAKGAASLGA